MTRPQGSDAAVRTGTGRGDDRTTSWLRENVIDVAPQWAEFLRSALAHVGTPARPPHEPLSGAPARPEPAGARRGTRGRTSAMALSRHIDAVLALGAPGGANGAGARFSPAPAAHTPGAEWPPDQWD